MKGSQFLRKLFVLLQIYVKLKNQSEGKFVTYKVVICTKNVWERIYADTFICKDYL